jgi:diguanylate cyclase (GGDEF)-like protein
MNLDTPTITFAGGVVSLAGGLILLMNWLNDRATRAALWWAASNCLLGLGVIGLALHDALPPFAADVGAPVILNLSAALAWLAARIFNRRRGRIGRAPIAATVLVAALIGAVGSLDAQSATALNATASAGFYLAAAIEFILARGERLRGRWPMVALLTVDGAALLVAAVAFVYAAERMATPSVGWFGAIHFVGLVYAVGSVALPVMMLRERGEALHKAAALADPLTGLANRRAFMERAGRLFARARSGQAPVLLLAFDLDRFKAVNDAFGHAAGDRVLRIFADVLSRVLRPADLVARLGGEEFTAALPDCSVEAALAIARRISAAFQNDARFLDGQRVGATVSVGVAAANPAEQTLAEAMASADQALYEAKSLGRNRVVLVGEREPEPAPVVRIA